MFLPSTWAGDASPSMRATALLAQVQAPLKSKVVMPSLVHSVSISSWRAAVRSWSSVLERTRSMRSSATAVIQSSATTKVIKPSSKAAQPNCASTH